LGKSLESNNLEELENKLDALLGHLGWYLFDDELGFSEESEE